VQGAELAVIDGAKDLLSSGRVRFALVSTHHHSISDDPLIHHRCLELLRSLGAHVIAEHTVAESCSGDGLIAVAFDPRDRDLVVPVSHVRAVDSLFGDPMHDVAAASAQAADARETLDRLRIADGAELDALRAELAQVTQELRATHATRTFRWSAGMRALYRRVRRA
jgi:hypothetical protein